MMRIGRLLSPHINQLQIISGKYKAADAPSKMDSEDEDEDSVDGKDPLKQLQGDPLIKSEKVARKFTPFNAHMSMFKGVLAGVSQLKPRYPTEFKALDDVLGGGLSPRVPTMVMSLPHQGKTTFLHEVIASTLKNRLGRVLYLTTIDDSLVVSRRVSGITTTNGKPAKPVARGGRVKIETIYDAKGLITRLARLIHSREHEEIVRVCKQEGISRRLASKLKKSKGLSSAKTNKTIQDRQNEWVEELETSDEEEIQESLIAADNLQPSSSGTRNNQTNGELNSELNGADEIDEALKDLEQVDLNAMTSISGEFAARRKKKAQNAVREYAYELVVIDNIDHMLNEVEKSWEHSMTYNRAAGAIMREICQTLGIPILVSCQIKSKLDETSLMMSPWPNFPGDVIHIERVRVKDETESRKYVSKRLVTSKSCPFYMCRAENLPSHSKLKFNMKVSPVSGCNSSRGRIPIKTEKTITQIPFSF